MRPQWAAGPESPGLVCGAGTMLGASAVCIRWRDRLRFAGQVSGRMTHLHPWARSWAPCATLWLGGRTIGTPACFPVVGCCRMLVAFIGLGTRPRRALLLLWMRWSILIMAAVQPAASLNPTAGDRGARIGNQILFQVVERDKRAICAE